MANKNNYLEEEDEISKAFSDPVKLTQILQAGIHKALLRHKQAGNPICEVRDNKVVWIPPEKIPVG
jgi:hypothetical protein